jgi:RNA polymerase subunit RPABC4/transcription elongation factor Spt4
MQNTQPVNMMISPFWNTVTLESMIKFCVIYFFVVWIGLIIWVARDISFRSNSKFYQVFCVLIMILLTPLWVFIYLLIRPRKSIYDRCSKEIEWNLEILSSIVQDRIESDIDEEVNEELTCLECNEEIEHDFIICPNCKTSLKDTCHECHKIIRESWKVCPYCETKQKKKKHKKTD